MHYTGDHLGRALHHICKYNDEDSTLSEQTYIANDFRIINCWWDSFHVTIYLIRSWLHMLVRLRVNIYMYIYVKGWLHVWILIFLDWCVIACCYCFYDFCYYLVSGHASFLASVKPSFSTSNGLVKILTQNYFHIVFQRHFQSLFAKRKFSKSLFKHVLQVVFEIGNM